MLCVSELKDQQNIYLLVTTTLNLVLERSEQARKQAGHLLHDVVKDNLLSVSDYLKG